MGEGHSLPFFLRLCFCNSFRTNVKRLLFFFFFLMTKSHLFSHTKKGFTQLFHRMQRSSIRHDHQTRYVVIFNFPDSSLGFIHAMIHAMVRQDESVLFKEHSSNRLITIIDTDKIAKHVRITSDYSWLCNSVQPIIQVITIWLISIFLMI